MPAGTSKHCDCLYHVTPTRNLPAIAGDGLMPQIGPRSAEAGEVEPFVHCFTAFEEVERQLKEGWAREFDAGETLALLAINLSPQGADPVECAYPVPLRPHLLWVVTDEIHADSDFAALRAQECLMIKDYMPSSEASLPIPGGFR
jgi:hypothetical protein